jgi:hypothetical protein
MTLRKLIEENEIVGHVACIGRNMKYVIKISLSETVKEKLFE